MSRRITCRCKCRRSCWSSSARDSRLHRCGFSLVEVLLALALIVVIAGSVLGLASTLLTRRDQIQNAGVRERGVSILVEQIERDVLGASVVVAAVGGGIVGTESSLTIRTHATSLNGSDVVESKYRFDSSMVGEGEDQQPGCILATRGLGAREEILASGVARVRFRYHDGVAWVDRFDSAATGVLPWAIEVSVWLGDPSEFAESASAESSLFTGGEDNSFFDADRGSATTRVPERSGSSLATLRAPDRLRVLVVPDAEGPPSSVSRGEVIAGGQEVRDEAP